MKTILIIIYIFIVATEAYSSADTIKIGLPDVPGLMFRSETGETVGIPLEITEKAFNDEGIPFKWVAGSWSELYEKLNKSEIDILPGTMKTEYREKYFDYLENSLYLIWSEVFIHKDYEYYRIQDFAGKKIGLIHHDLNSSGFIDYIDDFQIKYEKVWFNSHRDAMNALKRKEIFGFAAPNPNILNAILLDEFKRAGLFFNPVHLNIAFAKGKHPQIRQRIDERIGEYKNDPNSKLNELINLYRVSHISPQETFIPNWLIYTLIITLSAALLSFLFIYLLKKQVRLKTKDLLIAKEKAEESERLKSEFLANMSHEIRTPLNAIVGFSNIIAENDNTKEQTEEYSEIISKQTDILLTLINDIVDYAKIESNSLKYVYSKDVSIQETLDEVYNSFINNVPANIRFSKQYDTEDYSIDTDKLRMQQIINNFVSNAFKHTSKGEVILGYQKEDNSKIRVYVKDEGEGIPEEAQKQIFSRFFKADEFSEGAGLGLPISKAIAEHLGFEIGVESELGKGSLFYIIIDLNAEFSE